MPGYIKNTHTLKIPYYIITEFFKILDCMNPHTIKIPDCINTHTLRIPDDINRDIIN